MGAVAGEQRNKVRHQLSERLYGEGAEGSRGAGVVLVGGLQTMCFLLGVPDRYRTEWDQERG